MSYVSTDIKKIIAEIIENKKEKGGVKNIYFVGCGGSLGALYPAKTFMEREAQVLRSAWINSNHALFNNVYPIYNHALATKREHPLATRRYMWKVEY